LEFGVPLISSRLSSADCGVLLDKITGRIDSWLSKKLSYAGRLLLFFPLFYIAYKFIVHVSSSSPRRL
jgi:hypothetical protein